jgi:hypothetical protein
VSDHADELRGLGPGLHYGEWWGQGIGKRYSGHVEGKRFSLFNVSRWIVDQSERPDWRESAARPPGCCSVVPLLGSSKQFDSQDVGVWVGQLRLSGSIACPGAKAEGIVVFHAAASTLFKVTLDGDDAPKGEART